MLIFTDIFYYFDYVIADYFIADYFIATNLSVLFRVHPCTKLKLPGG